MKLPFARSWWIEPGKIIGGHYPGTKNSNESRQMLSDLLAVGVRVIVNLQEPDELGQGGSTFADYRPMVQELAQAQGITVTCHRFPVPDMGVPSHETMVQIQETIRQTVEAGQLVYVHCWGGHGRTGTIAGCWMVSQGATPAAALQMIKEQRSHDSYLAIHTAPQTTEQREMIKQWQRRKVEKLSNATPIATVTAGTFQDRAFGSLLGLAVGDAVGTTVEFKPPGTFKPLTDMIGGGPFSMKPGEWTDDTSMALCFAESLIERGFCDPIDQLTRYVRWWKEGHFSVKGHCFDIGNQVSAALSEFMSTKKPYCGPVGEKNAGNGSLMRLCPVAIAYAHDPSAAIIHAAQSSRTTHGNLECLDACRYFAGLLVGALNGNDKKTILSGMYSPIPGLWDVEPLQPKVAAIAAGSFTTRKPPEIRGTGYVVHCLEAALWAFHNSGSFEEAILLSANLGDDADTTAAVCGQIAGAFYGQSGIPAKWLTKLAQREVIEGLAKALWKIGCVSATDAE